MARRKNSLLMFSFVLIWLGVSLINCNFKKSESPPGNLDDNPDGPVEITLQKYQGVLRTIDARIGSVTFPFLFYTGGGLTLITPELAEEIGCVPFGRHTGFQMTRAPICLSGPG